jgi:hypothetical protein
MAKTWITQFMGLEGGNLTDTWLSDRPFGWQKGGWQKGGSLSSERLQ